MTQQLVPNGAEPLTLTTAAFEAAERLTIWHEVYGKHLFNLDIEPIGEQPFHASVTMRRVGAASITTGTRSKSHYRITQRHLAHARDAIMLIALRRGRAVASQTGREMTLAPGGVIAMSSSEIARFTLFDDAEYLSLYLPRPLLEPVVPQLHDKLVRPLATGSASLNLLLGYASSIQANPLDLSAQLQLQLADHLCDLAAHALLGPEPATVPSDDILHRGSLPAARLQAIHYRIAGWIDRHDLNVDTVARALQVSPSYIRKLLAREGTSFSDLVVKLRLQRAYKRLRDPKRWHQTIGSIAYEVGFSDLSYFNRCFRRQFGATPREVRQVLKTDA